MSNNSNERFNDPEVNLTTEAPEPMSRRKILTVVFAGGAVVTAAAFKLGRTADSISKIVSKDSGLDGTNETGNNSDNFHPDHNDDQPVINQQLETPVSVKNPLKVSTDQPPVPTLAAENAIDLPLFPVGYNPQTAITLPATK